MSRLLEIHDLCVEVKGKRLLRGVNLDISEGEIHAFLGPNGSGKTTLLMAIMGYPEYVVTSGEIIFDGQNLAGVDITERSRLGLGMAHQRPPTLTGVRLSQILDYVSSRDDCLKKKLPSVIKDAHLDGLLERDVNSRLSGGEIKRSELAQVIASGPRLALIDEPDSGVDPEALRSVGGMIRTLFEPSSETTTGKRSGIIVTHSANALRYIRVNRAHVMFDGTIGCSGTAEQVFDMIENQGYQVCIECISTGRNKDGQANCNRV